MRCWAFFFVGLVSATLMAPAASADLLGIDVSKWQASVNWNAMANAGVDFGFARATIGTNDNDEYFAQNMNGARAAGIPIGPYHYAHPESFMNPLSAPVKQDAVNEANDFVDRIKPYYDNYPGSYLRPVLDVEELPSNTEVNTTAEQRTYLSAWIKDFNNVVQDRLGVDVILYSNGYYASTFYTPDLAAFDLWFAKPTGSPNSSPPTSSNMGIWNDWVFWQYSWTGNVGGENPLDLNTFRGTEADLNAYLVGYEEPVTGDYNGDGVVNAADYTVWRDTYLAFGAWPADGNSNGVVDLGDYDLWAADYGKQVATAVGVPEPLSLMLLTVGLATAASHRR
ncbi:Lysozyme M1 precursor [Botrimarina colliarenosi]|uniref:Lysozyme M1 n=1 Tax=Botrimarina colliarenosi TaxID=2528001 RepID=A0A5C6AMP8_9BACT|nr:GH25 family lysozyme [Botrimarina colliarenosi]TWU00539.1 Lysozyme M1 precursor [Botrimarina colliarenosi]